MNDCWEILGIEPTDNKREIRSAYAAKSRQCHIEDAPEEFATLNQAYQEALNYVPVHKERAETNEIEPENPGITEIPDDGLSSDSSPSLLNRLQQAEEAEVEKSMETGALKQFISIFENARESGKVPRATVWKDFFLSEEFLKEQYEEGFARGMLQYLSEWSMEGNYNVHALPSGFLMELAIAYALTPETINHFSAGEIPGEVNAGGSFYGRECAASLWCGQSGRGYLPVRMILDKSENLVRLRSFSDYIRLRSLNQNNRLTMGNKNTWERILGCGRVNHLYEWNGKGSHDIYEETRSVCLIRLYTFWIQEDDVPACILEYMFKEYNLKNVEHSSSKKIYNPLRLVILKKYPDIEKELFGAESRIQMERDWYKELTKIVADNHSDYDKGIYEETDKTKERIRELFECPEWQKIQYSEELFDKMFGQFYKRMVVPESMAKRLIDFYQAGLSGGSMGRWKEKQRVPVMIQSLIQSLAFNRRIRDIDGLQPLGFGKTGIEDICDDNRDFWYYYLMVGFGFRKAELESGTVSSSDLYTLGSSCYLPLYIKYTYYPAPQWIRKFVGYTDPDSSGEGGGKSPTAVEFLLPDGKNLKVEFHLHYCLYTLDGRPVYQPEYTFGLFAGMAGKIEKTEQFFFLLAITEIREEERGSAQKLIEEQLSRLVLYPSTIPVIARLLSEGREDLVQTSDYDGSSSYYEKAVPVNMTRFPDRETVSEKQEPEIVEAVYYTEQEDYCFRVLVTDKTVRLYQQKKFGWYELLLPGMSGSMEQMGSEERKRWAETVLVRMRKPEPVSLGTVSLAGRENEEKAEKILEVLKRHEEYHRREAEWTPSIPAEEIQSVYGTDCPGIIDFFQREGSFLTESYCVLRFGSDKSKERVLYCGIFPYAFQAKEHNPEFESTYQFRLRELSRKIKEKHQIMGNFGWGDVYTPKETFEPSPFAIGESGTYYNFDVIRMYRTDNLASLLAKMFDLTNATEVEIYQGCLGFSRLDRKLEYCYGEEDLRKSMYSPDITEADVFVRFTRAERMAEFARWLNGILTHVDRLNLPLFVLEQERNAYSLSLHDRRGLCCGGRPEQEEDLMGENRKLFWKTGENTVFTETILEELQEMVLWYMQHGKCGGKLKTCLKVDAAAYSLPSGARQAERSDMRRTEWEIFKNASGIREAMKRRTAMTAYSLTRDKKEEPSLFDSKIGGMPYWEPDRKYPEDFNGKKMVLLAQINLDTDPMDDLIPGGGMLQFFGVADEIFRKEFGIREEQDSYQIVYHKQIDYHIAREELLQLGVPDSTTCYEQHTPVAGEVPVKVEKATVYMGLEDYRFFEVLREALEQDFGLKVEDARDFFYELLDEDEAYEMEREFANDGFWILGYPAFASNRNDPRQEDKDLRKYDRLLFQFDTHYLSDSYYYDADNECGIAHFFMRGEDLKNRDFDRAIYHWENCTEEKEEEEDWED